MDFVASVFTLRFKVLRCGSYICLLRNLSFPSRKEAVQSILYYLAYDYLSNKKGSGNGMVWQWLELWICNY